MVEVHPYWILGVLRVDSSFSPASSSLASPRHQQKLYFSHWWWCRSQMALREQGLGSDSHHWLPRYFLKHFLHCEMMGHLKDEWARERARLQDPNPGSTVKLGKLFYHVSNCAHNCSISVSMPATTGVQWVVYQCFLHKVVVRI